MEPGCRVRGINHITLAVGDLARSVDFYRDMLGLKLRAQWASGAYLEAGSMWLCLSLDPKVTEARRADYTHLAFDVDASEFVALASRLLSACESWKDNNSEGDSIYVLDPDGHKLELHVGTLATRLKAFCNDPPAGLRIFE